MKKSGKVVEVIYKAEIEKVYHQKEGEVNPDAFIEHPNV